MTKALNIHILVLCVCTALAGILLSPCATAQNTAIVRLESICMNALPEYGSSLETQELMGYEAEILERSGIWVKIRVSQPYEAWTTDKGLAMMTQSEIERYRKSEKYVCTVPHSSVRKSPDRKSTVITPIVWGDIMRIRHGKSGKALRRGGWLGVTLPDGQTGWTRKEDVTEKTGWDNKNKAMSAEEKTSAISGFAKSLLGVPYVWGGMTVCGMDCSGLVRLSYMSVGIMLPRNASQQALCGKPVNCEADPGEADGTRNDGTPYSLKNLIPGDIVYFGTGQKATHIGIYLGDGRFIHSSHLVRINSLRKSDQDFYENAGRLLGARRIVE